MITRAFSAAVGACVLMMVLTGCVASPSARTRPNAIERAALIQAAGYSGTTPSGTAEWVQLWTPNQLGPAVRSCVNRLSDGLIDAQVRLSDGVLGVSLSYALAAASAADMSRSFLAQRSAHEVVGRCIASTPLDARIFRVAVSSWNALYAYETTSLRRCLLAQGQTVAAVPTRERFEKLLRAGTPWSAYDKVVLTSRAAWYALSDACPALPLAIAGDVAAISSPATTR